MKKRALTDILLLSCILICSACVERYYPENDTSDNINIVVNAHLSNDSADQYIYLSKSSTLLQHTYEAINAYLVFIEREDGLISDAPEVGDGIYKMEQINNFFIEGKEYKLHLESPSGKHYESNFEKMHGRMSVDSIYYEFETMFGKNSSEITNGIRFYLNFNLNKQKGNYAVIKLQETFEFHNPNYLGYIYSYDRKLRELLDEESWRKCWITNNITEYYPLNLELNESGKFLAKRLNFVSNEPQRLHHKYSLLVKLYTLSESAYNYWNQLKENTENIGGLFGSQPAIIQSNIHNTEDKSEQVLGFFSVSGVSLKRITIERPKNLELIEEKLFCFPSMDLNAPRQYIPYSKLPVYYSKGIYLGETYFGETKKHCLDCREYKNSSHIQPDFW